MVTVSRTTEKITLWKTLSGFKNIGPFVALILLILLMSVFSKAFLNIQNLSNILQQSSVNLILGLGMTVVIISAGIDLSVGSVLSLAGVIMALLAISWGFNPFIAILGGVIAGTAVGMLNGFIISSTGIPDFIMTLGMLSAAKGMALVLTRGLPVPNLPAPMVFFGSLIFGSIPVAPFVALIMAVLVWYVLNFTKLGRVSYAIGGNREAARASGINLGTYKVMIYGLMGFCVAIASLVQIGRIYSANALMGEGLELQAIAVVIIGGTNLFGGEGGVGGTVLGALIMGVISDGLNLLDVSAFWQTFFVGTLIILIVVLDRFRRR
jgi:ribose/xylose/arabinose/galactoside ABC-type transport system permease subunit